MSKSMENTIKALEEAGVGVESHTKEGELREFLICDGRWRVWPDVKQVLDTISNTMKRYETNKELVETITGRAQGD